MGNVSKCISPPSDASKSAWWSFSICLQWYMVIIRCTVGLILPHSIWQHSWNNLGFSSSDISYALVLPDIKEIEDGVQSMELGTKGKLFNWYLYNGLLFFENTSENQSLWWCNRMMSIVWILWQFGTLLLKFYSCAL